MKNITLSLNEDLLRKVRIMAAEEGKAVSQLVSELLEERLRRKKGVSVARKRSLSRLANPPFSLGGKPLSREEVHER